MSGGRRTTTTAKLLNIKIPQDLQDFDRIACKRYLKLEASVAMQQAAEQNSWAQSRAERLTNTTAQAIRTPKPASNPTTQPSQPPLQMQQPISLLWPVWSVQALQPTSAPHLFYAVPQVGATKPLLVPEKISASLSTPVAGRFEGGNPGGKGIKKKCCLCNKERAGTHSRGCPTHCNLCKLEKEATHNNGCPSQCALCKKRKSGTHDDGCPTHCALCREARDDTHGAGRPSHCPNCMTKLSLCDC